MEAGEFREEILKLLYMEETIALKDAGVIIAGSLEEAVDSMDSDEILDKEDSSKMVQEYVVLRKELSKEKTFRELYTEIKRNRNKEARHALHSSHPSYMFEHTTVIPFFNEDGTHDPIEEGKDY